MDILKFALIIVVTLFLSNVLKDIKPEFYRIPIFILSLFIFGNCVEMLQSGIDSLSNLIYLKNNFEYIAIFLKLLFISFTTDFLISLSDDDGNSALSGTIALFGRISMIAIVMPYALKLFSVIKEESLYGIS